MEKGLPFPGVASTTDFTRNYLSYGSIFFERGYMTEAEHFLNLALRDDPGQFRSTLRLWAASICNKTNLPKLAPRSNACIKLPQRYPGTLPNAWNNLGLLSAREGHTDEAIQQFQQALQLDPDHFIALENLGNAYRQAKRWDDAKATLQHALQVQSRQRRSKLCDGHGLRTDRRCGSRLRLSPESRGGKAGLSRSAEQSRRSLSAQKSTKPTPKTVSRRRFASRRRSNNRTSISRGSTRSKATTPPPASSDRSPQQTSRRPTNRTSALALRVSYPTVKTNRPATNRIASRFEYPNYNSIR